MDNQEIRVNTDQFSGSGGIDAAALIKTILRKWWMIAIAVLLAAAAAFCFAKFLVRPTYQAHFTAYVNNKQAKQANSDSLTNSDILASQELVRTYSKILTGNTVLMKAAELLGADYTYRDLVEMVKTEPEDDTELIAVYVTADSPEEAYKIGSALETISPECMAEIIVGSSMKIVDTTQMPDMRHSPSYTKYTVIGALIGAVLMLAYIITKQLFDDKIKSDEGLEERYGLPVVGIIPDMSKHTSGGSYYYYYRKSDRKAFENAAEQEPDDQKND